MSPCAPLLWVLGPCPALPSSFSEQDKKASTSLCPKVAKPGKKPVFLILGVGSSIRDPEDGGDKLGISRPPLF